MKKLISIVLVVVFICLFGGCTNNSSMGNSQEIEELKKQIELLNAENKNLKTELDTLKLTNEDNKTENSSTTSEKDFPLFMAWLDQENRSSERDMYESIINGFVYVDDEIERGWLDEGSIRFLSLLKGSAVSEQATAQDLIKIYKSLDYKIRDSSYSIRDFFCIDDYGNSTNTGIYNFLETIDQLETQKFDGKDIVFVDFDGNVTGWDFDAVGGDAKIAEVLGISSELVLIIMHAAVDAGFDVSFG